MSGGGSAEPSDVLAFWVEAGPDKWFNKKADFDGAISERFADLHAAAAAGGKSAWAKTPEGALALVLVLDQFSRNMFRGSAKTFARDEMACAVAEDAIRAGFDIQVAPALRMFFYMPFMHSERIADQQRCVALFHAIASGDIAYARDHERIVRRFGRFPHRNSILGRHMTPAEQAFLDGGGFAG